jgi:hypothetical protein
MPEVSCGREVGVEEAAEAAARTNSLQDRLEVSSPGRGESDKILSPKPNHEIAGAVI